MAQLFSGKESLWFSIYLDLVLSGGSCKGREKAEEQEPDVSAQSAEKWGVCGQREEVPRREGAGRGCKEEGWKGAGRK